MTTQHGAVALEYSIALSCHNSIMTAYSYYHISTCIARVGKGLAPETERPASGSIRRRPFCFFHQINIRFASSPAPFQSIIDLKMLPELNGTRLRRDIGTAAIHLRR